MKCKNSKSSILYTLRGETGQRGLIQPDPSLLCQLRVDVDNCSRLAWCTALFPAFLWSSLQLHTVTLLGILSLCAAGLVSGQKFFPGSPGFHFKFCEEQVHCLWLTHLLCVVGLCAFTITCFQDHTSISTGCLARGRRWSCALQPSTFPNISIPPFCCCYAFCGVIIS